jgi:folate-binding protein YgfZ
LGFRLLVKRTDRQAVLDLLRDSGILKVEELEYRLLHLEAGIPFAGAELIEAYTPLETRLESAVSQSKGCYTGQEVIARQVTYDKITQRLCGVRLDAQLNPGRRLWAGEKLAGVVTSCAQSPRFGIIALAMLKRPHDLPGTQLEAEDEKGTRSPARVVALPFTTDE